MKKSAAFTLIELLIASAIFLVVAVTIYSAFGAGIFGLRHINESIDMQQAARQILERLDTDLRNAFTYAKDKESKFIGNASGISFLTLVDTFSVDKLEQEYAFVSYEVEGNTLMRACRKNQESLNAGSTIQAEEMSPRIEKLEFSYGYIDPFDKSLKLKDSWGAPGALDEQKTLPAAVAVKLAIKDKGTQEFQRTIYLPR